MGEASWEFLLCTHISCDYNEIIFQDINSVFRSSIGVGSLIHWVILPTTSYSLMLEIFHRHTEGAKLFICPTDSTTLSFGQFEVEQSKFVRWPPTQLQKEYFKSTILLYGYDLESLLGFPKMYCKEKGQKDCGFRGYSWWIQGECPSSSYSNSLKFHLDYTVTRGNFQLQ